MKELGDFIAARSSLYKADLQFVLSELTAAVIFFNKQGRGVKLPGLGTFLPTIGLDGSFRVSHRLDKEINNGPNTPGAYSGEITRRKNMGKTAEQLAALWNKDNPADPVE